MKVIIFRDPKNWDISKIAKIFSNIFVPYELGQNLGEKNDLFNRVKLFSPSVFCFVYKRCHTIFYI